MESSDPYQNYESQAQQQQGNTGLMRYRSAPSSYFTSLLDRDIYDDFLNRPSSPETEGILSGLMNGGFRQRDESGTHQLENIESGKGKAEIFQRQPKQEQEPQRTDYSQDHQSFYQNNSSQQMFPQQNIDYRSDGSAGDGGSACSSLLRQSSSPAGLFISNLNSIDEVSGAMRFNASTRDVSYSSATRFNPMNHLSSGQPSSSGQMGPIAGIGHKSLGKRTDGAEVRGFNEGHGDNYDAGFAIGSWEDSGLNALEAEEGLEIRDSTPQLAHHLSLPKSSLDVERLLQFQDSVPCKIRAKRGCATHPRSIAERVRRTKISERIRKLQDLVPNMDKQTNTTEMLDLAVDYIKELQEQVKMLSDSKSKCVCSSRQTQ